MPMYRMPGGGLMHLNFGGARNTARHAPKHCRAKRADGTVCACMAEFECDWPGCDIPLCADCARPIGQNRHLCPAHREQPGLDLGEADDEHQVELPLATAGSMTT